MKKVQILIITLVSVLVLGCIGFAVLYFATDIFRTNKQLFAKYSSQINLKEFINLEEYNNYLKRTGTQGHSNEGEFSIKMSQGEQNISETIKYSGYSDSSNNKSSYNISINKDDKDLLEMNYLRDQDLYGILFKDVVNQYVAFENNNLKEFATKLGIEDTESIPDKIELKDKIGEINYEELSNIINKYLNMAIEEIPEDNFYKIEKTDISLGNETIEANGYGADIKLRDLQSILIKVFENAKNDEQLFNLINRIDPDITMEYYQDYIDENLEQMSGEIPDEENIKALTISVYKQGKETVKLSINFAEDEENNIELSIEKSSNGMILRFNENNEFIFEINKTSSTDEQENFNIIITEKLSDEEETQFNINISRTGSLKSNKVTFMISIPITEDDTSVNIQYNNITNFSATPQFEEFKEGNHLVINTLPKEQIINLFTNLGNRLSEKLKDEMFVSFMVKNSRDSLYETARQTADETERASEQQALMNQM